MTSTSPGRAAPARTASAQASSPSKTRAGPVWRRRSVPASFTRLPSGARLPRRQKSDPAAFTGRSSARTTRPSGAGASAVAVASVPPCTAGASPSRWPPRTSSAMSAAVPPARWRSSATNRPAGARSAITGVRAATAVSWSWSSATPHSRAMARRCSTPFVEPPVAAMPAIAFSNARRSRKARADGPPRASAVARAPARAAAAAFSASASAGIRPSPMTAAPRHSSATAIVLAVKCPAHVPGPGHAPRSSSSRSARDRPPRSYAPTASHTSWIVTATRASARRASGRWPARPRACPGARAP